MEKITSTLKMVLNITYIDYLLKAIKIMQDVKYFYQKQK
jgi:hypothetical protein